MFSKKHDWTLFCQVCHVLYDDPKKLILHQQKSGHPERFDMPNGPFFCIYCNKKFKTKEETLDHQAEPDSVCYDEYDEDAVCPKCKYFCKCQRLFKLHTEWCGK